MIIPLKEYKLDNFVYKYKDETGTHTKGATSSSPSAAGWAKKFDLKAIRSNVAPKNHNGYLSYQVKKGNKKW